MTLRAQPVQVTDVHTQQNPACADSRCAHLTLGTGEEKILPGLQGEAGQPTGQSSQTLGGSKTWESVNSPDSKPVPVPIPQNQKGWDCFCCLALGWDRTEYTIPCKDTFLSYLMV